MVFQLGGGPGPSPPWLRLWPAVVREDTKRNKKQGFLSHFIIGGLLIWGKAASWAPLATLVAYVKNNAVLEPRIGHFRGLVGFEAKAKDLSFEAKNFKMCPRELHL